MTTEVDYSYVCCCLPVDRSALATSCSGCGVVEHAINFHTGERLPEGAVSSWTP